MISKIEIEFQVPVEMPKDWDRRLYELVCELCQHYESEHLGRVMWPFGVGSKPTYIPMTMEEEKRRGIEFDDSIYHIEVAEREAHKNERELR